MVTGLLVIAPKIIEILKKKESFQNKNKKNTVQFKDLLDIFLILLNLFMTWYAVFLSGRCKSSGFVEAILAFLFPYLYLPFRYNKPCK